MYVCVVRARACILHLAASPQSSMVATCIIVKSEAKKRPKRAASLVAQCGQATFYPRRVPAVYTHTIVAEQLELDSLAPLDRKYAITPVWLCGIILFEMIFDCTELRI